MVAMNPLLTLVVFLCSTASVLARNVNVDVKAPWQPHIVSFIAEYSEFVFEHSNEYFWQYVSDVCAISQKVDEVIETKNADTVNEVQSLVSASAVKQIPKPFYSLMDTMIGLGNFLPAVQFFQSLADKFNDPCNGEPFVVLYPGEVILCSAVENLQAQFDHSEGSKTEIVGSNAAWDHVYNFNGKATKTVLYGTLGTSSFCSLHNWLVSHPLVRDGEVQYSIRHALFDSSLTPDASGFTRLQGYGVYLDIKNMEYKNVDDEASKTAAGGGEEGSGASDSDSKGAEDKPVSFAEDEEVQGINFSKLHSSLPDSGNELMMLREELKKAQSSEEGSIEDMKLKIWKMKDLGLQTMQLISSAGVQGTAAAAIDKFADIAQNFPRMASLVSSTKVSSSVRRDVERLTESGVLFSLPSNSLFINGKRTDLGGNTFNIFDLLEEVQEELLLQGKLSGLKLDRATKKGLVSVANNVGNAIGGAGGEAAAFGGPINRIDVSRGGKYVVHFLNNLEKDPQYRAWPSSLKQLLYPSWSLHTIAKNLYTLISVVDVMSAEGATILMQVQMFLQQYPIRFGVALSCSSGSTSEVHLTSTTVTADGQTLDDSELATSADFCRLYAHVRASYDASFSTAFLFAVTEAVYEAYNMAQAHGNEADPAASRITRGQLVETYASIIATLSEAWTSSSYTAEAQEVLRAQSYSDYLRNTSLYLDARGLPVNSYSLNGIVVNDINLQSSLMQLISREQYIMTQYYQKKVFTDKSKSIYADVMNHTAAFARYHPMLDDKNIQYVDFNTPAGQQLMGRLSFANPLLSQDITVSTVPHFELANSTVLVVPLTVAGYQAATTTIEWLLHNHDKIATLDGSNHRLAIVHSVSATEDDSTSAQQGEVLQLLRVVEESMSVPIGDASVCDFECLKALVLVYRMLQDSLSFSKITNDLYGYLRQLTPLEAHRGVATIERLKASLTAKDFASALSAARQKFSLAKDVLQVDAGDILIVYNARKLEVLTPPSPSKRPIHELDLELLASLEQSRLTAAVVPLLDKMRAASAVSLTETDPTQLLSRYETHSNALLKLSSYCGYYNSQSGKRYDINGLLDRLYSESFESVLFSLEPDMSDFTDSSDDLKIVWVIDPLTLAGQRAASIIKLVRDHLHYSQTILFTPRTDITSFPLQNFYRYVLSPHDSHKALASFTQLPRQHVLTARVDIPEPWNVQTSAAMQDIDNLRCIGSVCGDPSSKKKDLTEISYALKNLLVSGQCFQSVPGDPTQSKIGLPPNGLQLTLTPSQSYFKHLRAIQENTPYALTDRTDTLVMQNLGYYQLQANPGLYILDLAEGKATDLYTIKKAESFGGQFVAVRSFGDVLHRLIVSKRSGMEHIPLIETDNSHDAMANPFFTEEDEAAAAAGSEGEAGEGGLWNNLKSSLFGSSADKPAKAVKAVASSDEDDTLHVFSLATGHMYERLLRIMMLSVTRHSSKPVKFWLFENYLSPTFKAIADEMAREYGFQVGYVTYKWPQWLTQQTQQQRIIWGYKILFLDVLFPLNVKKVIYVDADQVVRADLKELWDMDLKGKPYAYTPFCTSRQETLGFQFWRQGYWKDHLQGKPYHISALYVVDLQKFRKNAVGDSLRAIYDNLSRDPNSLANLDQDLPNYAQHQVPIHSLPQEWLWCETWCSDDSKKKAKTIDLCNNPLHKEPKLDMARRVISGELFNQSWVSLDSEIRELERRKGFTTAE